MKNHSRHFVAATCALAAFSPVEMMAQKQPNFVIIVADDMGYGDVGIYGNEYIKTPYLYHSGVLKELSPNQLSVDNVRLIARNASDY